MNTHETQKSLDGGLSLGEVLTLLWASRLIVTIVTLAAAALASIIVLMIPPKFEAVVQLEPVISDTDGGRLGGALLSQFGGLVGLGGAGSNLGRRSEVLATLQSRALTRAFLAEQNLLPTLYADDWDSTAGKWRDDDPKKQPTMWKAELFFSKAVRQVTEDKKTGLISLKITWTDPTLAASWANDLVKKTNLYLREKSIAESKRNLEYLNEQLANTSVVELQKSIYGLIEAEIKKMMIAQGNDEFAFKVIDPAVAPERRSAPKRTQIVIIATLGGFILAAIIAILKGSIAVRSVRDELIG